MKVRSEAAQTGVDPPLREPARDRGPRRRTCSFAAGLYSASRNPTERAHEKHAYASDMPGSAAAVKAS